MSGRFFANLHIPSLATACRARDACMAHGAYVYTVPDRCVPFALGCCSGRGSLKGSPLENRKTRRDYAVHRSGARNHLPSTFKGNRFV